MKNNNIKYAIIQESEHDTLYINGAICQDTIVTERPVAYEDVLDLEGLNVLQYGLTREEALSRSYSIEEYYCGCCISHSDVEAREYIK